MRRHTCHKWKLLRRVVQRGRQGTQARPRAWSGLIREGLEVQNRKCGLCHAGKGAYGGFAAGESPVGKKLREAP